MLFSNVEALSQMKPVSTLKNNNDDEDQVILTFATLIPAQ